MTGKIDTGAEGITQPRGNISGNLYLIEIQNNIRSILSKPLEFYRKIFSFFLSTLDLVKELM